MNLREWAKATHQTLNMRPADQRHHYFSITQVEQVLHSGILTLVDALISGERVGIEELGQLWVEEKNARRVVSNLPKRSQTYYSKPRRILRFRPSTRLTARIRQSDLAED